MYISELMKDLKASKNRLDAGRREIGTENPWYMYDILGNLPTSTLMGVAICVALG